MISQSSANRLTILQEHIKYVSSDIKTVGNIDFQEANEFLKIVLNRPKALNSMDISMVRVLNSQLEIIDRHSAFWIEGAGGKAFCAGGDVKVLFQKQSSVEDRKTFFREEFALDYRVSQLKAVQISNWDGIIMGGGVGISGFGPFIIATQNTLFAMPEAKLGFFADVGSSYILSRLRNHIGYYLGMTGAPLKGEEVYIAGIANYYIPRASIPEAYEEIELRLQKSQNPRDQIRKILSKYHKPSGKTKIDNQDQIHSLFGLGSSKAIYQRALSLNDNFHQNVVKLLDNLCPVSVELIHRVITNAKGKTLRECLILDYQICERIVTDSNFAEGVRCVLVEKGRIPKWSRKSILEVENEEVEKFFTPIEGAVALGI